MLIRAGPSCGRCHRALVIHKCCFNAPSGLHYWSDDVWNTLLWTECMKWMVAGFIWLWEALVPTALPAEVRRPFFVRESDVERKFVYNIFQHGKDILKAFFHFSCVRRCILSRLSKLTTFRDSPQTRNETPSYYDTLGEIGISPDVILLAMYMFTPVVWSGSESLESFIIPMVSEKVL